jgi:hypothetical protein
MAGAKKCGGVQSSDLGRIAQLKVGMVGMAVIFASLGLGEAVYRVLFFDFDGATDRLPIEMMFGLAFAWVVMKLVKRIYQQHLLTSAKINQVWDRNYKIRHAVEAIPPVPFPAHQQAIRVIRDEVERIEWALADIQSQ